MWVVLVSLSICLTRMIWSWMTFKYWYWGTMGFGPRAGRPHFFWWSGYNVLFFASRPKKINSDLSSIGFTPHESPVLGEIFLGDRIAAKAAASSWPGLVILSSGSRLGASSFFIWAINLQIWPSSFGFLWWMVSFWQDGVPALPVASSGSTLNESAGSGLGVILRRAKNCSRQGSND